MKSSSLQRWLTSKYATSWQLAVALLANYFLTGYFFGVTETSATGVTNHALDFLTGASAGLVVLVGALIRKKIAKFTFTGVQILFAVSSIISMGTGFFVRVLTEFRLDTFDVVISGLLQMFVIHNVLAMVVSSLMETRSQRRELEIQRSKLDATKTSFENQIEEINLRLANVVNTKLSLLLGSLKESLINGATTPPSALAHQISEALNEGVRPLSWEIEKSEVETNRNINVKVKRVGLIERLNFKIRFEQFVGLRLLTAIFLFFDVPVMYFYFSINAAIETVFVIAFTILVLWGLKTFTTKIRLRSWLAIFVYSVVVTAASSTFIVYRSVTGELTPDVAEIALVLSMLQIALLAAIFQSAIVRRLAYIGAQKDVNRELEQLVSQLRQRAWVAKKNLARLVHGQVQSELFAAYLQLSQANQPDAQLYQQAGARIERAMGALNQTGGQAQDFEATLEQIVATWGANFNVNTDISGQALAALRADQVATACAVEVILEAVNNAAKYGTSGQADLVVKLTEDSNLYIEVTNGADAGGASSAGYGSTVLDDVTHEWEFEITEGIAKLTAEVILSQPAG